MKGMKTLAGSEKIEDLGRTQNDELQSANVSHSVVENREEQEFELMTDERTSRMRVLQKHIGWCIKNPSKNILKKLYKSIRRPARKGKD